MDDFTGNAPLTPSEGELPTVEQPALAEALPSVEDPAPTTTRTPYTRRRPARRTVEAINDLAEDDTPASYIHESDISSGGMVQDGSYRRARTQVAQLQKSSRYGQYLEVPKGRRSIFAKRERRRRRQSALAAILVVALLAAIAYIVWQIMSTLSFGTLITGG